MRGIPLLLLALFLGPLTPSTQAAEPFVIKVATVGRVDFATIVLPPAVRLSVQSTGWVGAQYVRSASHCRGAMITGSYSSDLHKPAGLVVINGAFVAAQNARSDGGIVIIDRSNVSIARIRNKDSWPKLTNALQTQPILIFEGNLDLPLLDARAANRAALGKLKNGRLIMVMAYNTDHEGLSAITLYQFAEQAQRIMGGDVDWLINLDGGPSAFLMTPKANIAPANGGITTLICAELPK